MASTDVATPEDLDEYGLPEELHKRYLKLIKLGLTKGELASLMEQNDFTPVVVTYDLKANPELSKDAVEKLILDFREEVASQMRVREIALLFLKGLGLVARAAVKGGLA